MHNTFAFPQQKWSGESPSMLHYTYSAWPVLTAVRRTGSRDRTTANILWWEQREGGCLKVCEVTARGN